jgi:tetratricopeptide (TPR) repeat protein
MSKDHSRISSSPTKAVVSLPAVFSLCPEVRGFATMNRLTTGMSSDTRSVGPTREGTRRGAFPRNRLLGFTLLAGLGAVTVWNVTRSDALTMAEQAYERGNDVKALGLALDHLNRRPWSQAANLVAARALWRLHDVARATPYASRAGPLGQDDRHRLGAALVLAGRHEEAASTYQSIASQWPDDMDAVRQLAVIRRTQGRRPAAMKLALQLAQSEDMETQVIGFTLVGTISSDTRDFDRTVSSYENVIKLDPELRWVPVPRKQFWAEYARALLETGQSNRAQSTLERALEEVGSDATLQNRLDQSRRQPAPRTTATPN